METNQGTFDININSYYLMLFTHIFLAGVGGEGMRVAAFGYGVQFSIVSSVYKFRVDKRIEWFLLIWYDK